MIALSRGESAIPVDCSKKSTLVSGELPEGTGALGSGAGDEAGVVAAGAGDSARSDEADGARTGNEGGAFGPGLTGCSIRPRPGASSLGEHDAEPASAAPLASPTQSALPQIRLTWVLIE
jgi:hypothetical protein